MLEVGQASISRRALGEVASWSECVCVCVLVVSDGV